ncbi:hypothetical protein EMCRGX_G004663 [Ephydatia muelleri]
MMPQIQRNTRSHPATNGTTNEQLQIWHLHDSGFGGAGKGKIKWAIPAPALGGMACNEGTPRRERQEKEEGTTREGERGQEERGEKADQRNRARPEERGREGPREEDEEGGGGRDQGAPAPPREQRQQHTRPAPGPKEQRRGAEGGQCERRGEGASETRTRHGGRDAEEEPDRHQQGPANANATREDAYKRANVSAQVEVGSGFGRDKRNTRPADVLVPNWSLGKPAAFDHTITSPLNPSILSEAGVMAGSAALVAECRKQ